MHEHARPDSRPSGKDALLRDALTRVQAAANPEEGAAGLLDVLHGDLGITGGLVALRVIPGVRVLAAVGLPPEWTTSWTDVTDAVLEAQLQAGLVRESLSDPTPKIDLQLKRLGIRGVLTVPLVADGRNLGAIAVTSTRREPFGDEDRASLERVAAAFAEWVAPSVPHETDFADPLDQETVEAFAPPVDVAPDALPASLGAMAVATLDAEGRFCEVGHSFERLLGAPPESLAGKPLAAALAPEDESRAIHAIDTVRSRTVAVLPSATPRSTDERAGHSIAVDLILSQRTESSIVVFGLPVVDVVAAATLHELPPPEGGVLRRPYSGVMILDRRKIETSGQWRRWSGELLSVLGGSTLVLDPDGHIVELGSDWPTDGEGSAVGRLGRHFGELFDGDGVEVLEALRAVAREGMWSGRFPEDGIPVPVYLRAVRDERGELEAIVGARLPERSPEVRDLFQKIPVGLIVVDSDLRVLDTNPELRAALHGCSLPDDLRGSDLRSLGPFQTPEVQEALESLPRTRRLDLPDVPLARVEPAAPLVVHLHAQELSDANEQPVGFLLTLLGLAGKTRLETRMIESQKMDSIGNFAAGLSHDFGNLVAVILGKSKALRQKIESNAVAARQLVDIEVAAKRAQHLAEELMRFARGGRNRDATLEVNGFIKEVVALIEASVGSNIDVKFELAEGLPSIEGDEVELQQMVLNLCLNARDAMEDGGTLLVETRALAPDELSLVGTGVRVESGVGLRIRDTGKGIPDEIRDHIFEPFFSTKEDQSNGLGLAMVYAIVRRHGGTIDVRSDSGCGTEFQIMLPGAGTPVPGSVSELRVLVADDEPAFREMIRLIVEDLGYEVQLARDGVEALAAIHDDHEHLGLLVLDLMMPGIDGLTVLHELRSLAPELPVLVTTGWAEPEDVKTALERGAKRVLQKPYRAAELRTAVWEIMAASRAADVRRPTDSGAGWSLPAPPGEAVSGDVAGGD